MDSTQVESHRGGISWAAIWGLQAKDPETEAVTPHSASYHIGFCDIWIKGTFYILEIFPGLLWAIWAAVAIDTQEIASVSRVVAKSIFLKPT